MSGKGSAPRPYNVRHYGDNYTAIFGDGTTTDPICDRDGVGHGKKTPPPRLVRLDPTTDMMPEDPR